RCHAHAGHRARKRPGPAWKPAPRRSAGGSAAQRWRAFSFGLLLQITNTLPRRRTTLQSRCRVLADLSEDRTFMGRRTSGRANQSAAVEEVAAQKESPAD